MTTTVITLIGVAVALCVLVIFLLVLWTKASKEKSKEKIRARTLREAQQELMSNLNDQESGVPLGSSNLTYPASSKSIGALRTRIGDLERQMTNTVEEIDLLRGSISLYQSEASRSRQRLTALELDFGRPSRSGSFVFSRYNTLRGRGRGVGLACGVAADDEPKVGDNAGPKED